jgi:hypothetical protein
MITNKEGRFYLESKELDSVRVSMIGYQSHLLLPPFDSSAKLILLNRVEMVLEPVVVAPLSAEQIIAKAISVLNKNKQTTDFENFAFYREIIKDKERYFSVSEALFKVQYFLRHNDFKLSLEQGRAKEDVAYTRLFEDYHPGGGPQLMAKQAFVEEIPDCLHARKMKYFGYKKEPVTYLDDHRVYVINFDQKDGIKQALEKGTLFIDAEDFSLLQYIASNSPKGIDHIKSLNGGDKIMAKILGIDFDVIGWSRRLDFTKSDSISFLNFASYEREFTYRQPKKEIDLHVTMSLEWMISEMGLPIKKIIKEDEEWKKSNLIVNLPTAFDSFFWGEHAVIAPTDSLQNIIRSISTNNNEVKASKTVEGWKFFNPKFFVAWEKDDQIILTPTMKCKWNDETSGPMLFKDTNGNFNFECDLQTVKNSDANEQPDKGFQQGGLILRSASPAAENNIAITIGTAGNPNKKLFFKKTINGKTKAIVMDAKNLPVRIRIEKRDDGINIFVKWMGEEEWRKVGEYKAAWLQQPVQVGMIGYADFTGNGPKMHPDARFIFSRIEFKN